MENNVTKGYKIKKYGTFVKFDSLKLKLKRRIGSDQKRVAPVAQIFVFVRVTNVVNFFYNPSLDVAGCPAWTAGVAVATTPTCRVVASCSLLRTGRRSARLLQPAFNHPQSRTTVAAI